MNSLAQIGAGDERIVAGPGYREIPKCKFPLKTDEARAEYDQIARVLYDAGRFDLYRHSKLSLYAASFDQIHLTISEGRPVRGEVQKQAQRAYEGLGLDDLSKPIAAPKGAQENKYAGCGFSARRR